MHVGFLRKTGIKIRKWDIWPKGTKLGDLGHPITPLSSYWATVRYGLLFWLCYEGNHIILQNFVLNINFFTIFSINRQKKIDFSEEKSPVFLKISKISILFILFRNNNKITNTPPPRKFLLDIGHTGLISIKLARRKNFTLVMLVNARKITNKAPACRINYRLPKEQRIKRAMVSSQRSTDKEMTNFFFQN